MTRSWLINREHLKHLIDSKYDGRVSEFVAESGVDKNTARRWLKAPKATTYGSTVAQLTKTFELPAAAFAYRAGAAASVPKWLNAICEFSGNGRNLLGHGPVLPFSEARPITRSWPYKPPTERCWGLIKIEYTSPAIKLEIATFKNVVNRDLWFSLGKVRGHEGSYTVETQGRRHRFRAPSKHRPRSFFVGLMYDEWPDGFIARADTPFVATEVDRMCHEEFQRTASDELIALATIHPLTVQSAPLGSANECPHCHPLNLTSPPVSGVVRRDGRPVRRKTGSDDHNG